MPGKITPHAGKPDGDAEDRPVAAQRAPAILPDFDEAIEKYAQMHFSATRFTVLAATLAVAALIAPAARAQVVYDNGIFDATSDRTNITTSASADDFFVDGSLTFDAIRFYAMDVSDDLLQNFSGTLSWFIYESDGIAPTAKPSTTLASGTVSGADIAIASTGVALGGNPNFVVAQLDFDIPTQTLGTGTYWLRIKEGGLTSAGDGTSIFWTHTNGARSGNGFRFDTIETAPVDWNDAGFNNEKELAYQLRGNATVVPEAGTLALVGAGLAAFGAVVVRRKTAGV